MKSMFAALATAFACLTLSVGGVAHAQTKPKSGNEEVAARAALEKGMNMAPAMIAGAQVPCTPTAANFLFAGKADRDGKKVDANFVEVACQNNLGYVLQGQADGATTPYDCIITSVKLPDGKDHPLKCKLEGNANPARTLQSVVDKAGLKCAIDKGVPVGMTATALFYELSCKDADGVFIGLDLPRSSEKVQISSCYQRMATSTPCTLTTKEQSIASVMVLATKGDKGCAATNQKYVGRSEAGNLYYEFACPDQTGFIVEAKGAEFSRAIPCNQASGILGGCTLTASTPAPATGTFKTEDNAIYTQLAKKAGFNCDVAKYGVFPRTEGMAVGSETIELICSNRPDGGVGLFGDTNHVLSCIQGRTEGYRCSGSEEAAGYPLITAALKAKGRDTCKVSNAQPVGVTKENDYMEVACDDGLPGFVVVYKVGQPVLVDMLTCGQAASIQGGCKLPGNKKT